MGGPTRVGGNGRGKPQVDQEAVGPLVRGGKHVSGRGRKKRYKTRDENAVSGRLTV